MMMTLPRPGLILRRTLPAGWLLAAASLVGLSFVLVAGEAAAVAPPTGYVYVTSEIPAGGLITGTYQCTAGCSSSPPTFQDSQGAAIAGVFLEGASGVSGPFVFEPSSPLTPGSYTAYVTGVFTTSSSFTVVEATNELPTFVSSLTTEKTPYGEQITCDEQDSQAPVASFTEQMLVKPVLNVSLDGLYSTQYRYAITLAGETPEPVSGTYFYRTFEAQGGELCFDLLGFSYEDDSVTEIGSDCLSLGDMALGVVDERSGSMQQTLLGCVVPPAGYESEWCGVFDPAFGTASCDGFTLDACFAARKGCPLGDQPSEAEEQEERDARAAPPTGGVSGAGGSASGGVTLGSGGGGQGASESTGGSTAGSGGSGTRTGETPSGEVRACSLVSAPSGGGLGWLLLGLPVAFGVRRRRLG
jgi:hypothetical protein